MYYIWFDESDKDGEFYSNFYGGVLIKSEDLENVLQMANSLILELGIEEEIKWQRVNAFMYEKYEKVVDFIFDLLKYDKMKIRIFFRNNQYRPIGLTREHKRHEYQLLYYQFIKHAFGLEYSNDTGRDLYIKLLIDDIPLKGEDKDVFKDFIYRLNFDEKFKKAKIKLRKEDIGEVDSSKHIPLQFMDLILGAICFRLNDKHKLKDPQTGKRGNRTIQKEKLYKYINRKIRELKPGFNIGESTATVNPEDRWFYPYSHWSFKPYGYLKDTSLSKKQKKSPTKSTE